jgi:hypothetical protein
MQRLRIAFGRPSLNVPGPVDDRPLLAVVLDAAMRGAIAGALFFLFGVLFGGIGLRQAVVFGVFMAIFWLAMGLWARRKPPTPGAGGPNDASAP